MVTIYDASTSRAPSKQGQDAYIFAVIPTAENGLAAITSVNELLVLDRQNLSSSPIIRFNDVPLNVVCLVSGDDDGKTTICCGSDGVVATHDIRTQSRISHLKLDKAITALSRKGQQIAVGTELSNHSAVVSVWDQRNGKQLWQNSENNDDITALDFHPSRDSNLLAGGDDGQISIFDTSIPEEEDSLLQGVNHGPIHKAGFLGDHRFFALSSDQNLSIHPVASSDDTEDPQPTLLGDLRPLVPCEYVIDIFQTGEGFAVAAGSNLKNPNVKIIELRHAGDISKTPRLKTESVYVLEGGHGEEVVRSLFTDDLTGTIFTAGEDGNIKAFQHAGNILSPATPKSSKGKKPLESRYKPY